MAGFLKEKRQWLVGNWKPLLAIAIIGLIPFLGFLFAPGQALYASDALGAPSWRYYFDALRSGSIPLWHPWGLGGMPSFDAGFGDGAYPLFLLIGSIMPIKTFISWCFIVHVIIAGFTAYYLVSRFFKLDKILATALAVAYMLNTNFISHIHAGHTGKFYIMAWLPLSLYLLLRSLQAGARWYHSGLFALSITLLLSTFHPQFIYYVLMGYFLVWAYKTFWLVKEKRLPSALVMAAKFWVPIFCGIGLVFFLFHPPMQWTKHYGVRGTGEKTTFEHATSWSMHPEEAASLIVPEFTGLNEKYWGRNPFKLNSEYPGLTVLFLGVLGFALFHRDRRKWMWLWGSVSLLAVIFGLGANTPLFRLFYAFVPGIKNFRAPSMMLFWLATALFLMSAYTLARLSDPKALSAERKGAAGKRLFQIGFGISALMIFAGLMPGVFLGVWDAVFGGEGASNLANRASNQSAFAMGAMRGGVLLAVLVWFTRKWMIDGPEPLRYGLVLLAVTCADLIWVDANFIKVYNPDRMLPEQPAITYLKSDTSSFRVFGIPGTYERWMMQYHLIETADGWTDNEYRLYREFRGGDYMNNPFLMAGLKQNPDGTVSGSSFLDILNVKYLAYRLEGEGAIRLAPNTTALPRAWFVDSWRTGNDTAILENMRASDFNPRTLAYVSAGTALPEGFTPSRDAEVHATVLDRTAENTAAGVDTAKGGADSAASNPSADSSKAAAAASATVPLSTGKASIQRVVNTYNRHVYKVENSVAGILVLSELWFPHWRLKVDGKESTLLRTDFAFRGAALSPGSHDVEFTYHSPWIRTGFMVAGLSLIVLTLFLFGLSILAPRLERPFPERP